MVTTWLIQHGMLATMASELAACGAAALIPIAILVFAVMPLSMLTRGW